VWELEVKWAREHWEEVKRSEGMKKAGERMKEEGGGSVYEVETLLRLLDVGGGEGKKEEKVG
jgi:hypothetical protein